MGILLTGLLSALAGVGGGAAARLLLARLRRGARVRAPVCEVAVGAAWAVTGATWAAGALPGAWVPALLGLGWLGPAAAVVDLRHHRLPDALTLPALPVALVLLAPVGPGAVLRGAAGAAVAVAVYGTVHAVGRPAGRRALGAGDVKLAGPLGAVLAGSSWAAPVLAAVLAAVLTAALAVAVLLRGRRRPGRPGAGPVRATAVPHGPSMLLATWAVALGAALGGAAG